MPNKPSEWALRKAGEIVTAANIQADEGYELDLRAVALVLDREVQSLRRHLEAIQEALELRDHTAARVLVSKALRNIP